MLIQVMSSRTLHHSSNPHIPYFSLMWVLHCSLRFKKYESILYEIKYQIIFYKKNINIIASSVYILGKTMASYYLQFSTRTTDVLVWIQIMKTYMSVAGDDCIDVNADLLLTISLLYEFLYLTRDLTNGKSSGKELQPRGTENLTNKPWLLTTCNSAHEPLMS